jgi:hypothetical protein
MHIGRNWLHFRYGVFTFLAVFAFSAAGKAQDTKTQCYAAVPRGWVTIGFSTDPSCGLRANNQQTIKYIANLPLGSSVEACSDFPPPLGFAITSYLGQTPECGGGWRYTLRNLNDERPLARVLVCFDDELTGWVVIAREDPDGKCGNPRNKYGRLMLNLNGVSNLTFVVCNDSRIPEGWSVIGPPEYSAACGGSPGNAVTIRNGQGTPLPSPRQ